MPSTLATYLARTTQLPDDALLGHLVMFTIREHYYDRDHIAATLARLQMNPNLLPAAGRGIDAFRKATSSVDDFDYQLPDGNIAHILVRDVDADKELVTRHLIREIRDASNRRLAYSKIGEAVFYRPVVRAGARRADTQIIRVTIDHSTLVDAERHAMQPVLDRINEVYNRHLNFIDDMKVRAMMRAALLNFDAVVVKGGVYFAPIDQHHNLDKLTELISATASGSLMHLVPILDQPEQREMVIESLQAATETDLAALVETMTAARTKNVTPHLYAKLRADYEQVLNRADTYAKSLGAAAARTTGASDLAGKALLALQHAMLEGS